MMIPFDEKFPVHTETLTNVKDLNRILENDIRESGDGLQGRNASAKCLMTRWDMHDQYKSFRMLGNAAIQLASLCHLRQEHIKTEHNTLLSIKYLPLGD